MSEIAICGAGKIGRAFIAHIFASNGYSITFIDVDQTLIELLNQYRQYTVATLHADGSREDYLVQNVRGLLATDQAALELLCRVNLVATSVGGGALPKVARILAQAARLRAQQKKAPFDCILAENMRNSRAVMEHTLKGEGLPAAHMPGLIPASVGKTAPDLKPAANEDPLVVFGDSYNTLTVARSGWKNPPPSLPELQLVENIEAYMDRKLFIHNLAHVCFAYLGFQSDPTVHTIAAAMKITEVAAQTERIMQSVINMLAARWPQEFSIADLHSYCEAALQRMSNPALQDTIFRVGRDIARKLGREERIVGALLLLQQKNIPVEDLIKLYCAALQFRAVDEQGGMFPLDREFHTHLQADGIKYALYEVSQLNSGNYEKQLAQSIIMCHNDA